MFYDSSSKIIPDNQDQDLIIMNRLTKLAEKINFQEIAQKQ
jgi:hypothetical protein